MADRIGPYAGGTLRDLVDATLDAHDREVVPVFYAVAGSHAHGTAGPESDVDVRGVHCADGTRYALLDPPVERLSLDADAPPPGVDAPADVDLVSYELRTFGRLLAESNFNAVEVAFQDRVVADERPDCTAALRDLIRARLPLELPDRYAGMADQLYRRYLADPGDDPRPDAKHYLYVVRALLAARYVAAERDVESDVRALADAVLDDTRTVDDLVALRRRGGDVGRRPDLRDRANALVSRLRDRDPPASAGSFDRDDYRDRVDEWMLDVRLARPVGGFPPG